MTSPDFQAEHARKLRVAFMGTAPLSCASLKALLHWPNAEIVGVVTQPDRPKGRELRLCPSPVKQLAVGFGLRVLQPERARNEAFQKEFCELEAELAVVAAYGQILPQSLLDMPRFGCINVHTSLLPKYRGAAPIQWALLNDEAQTGVTIMKMDAGLDTGDILSQQSTQVLAEDDSETLHNRLAGLGAALLIRTIPDYVAGRIQPRLQEAREASYAPKIKKEDGRIHWEHSARTIWSRVRALVPWPGAFTFLASESKQPLLKIWRAEVAEASGNPGEILHADKEGILVGCGEKALRILTLQREGGRRLESREFLTGHPLKPGARFC